MSTSRTYAHAPQRRPARWAVLLLASLLLHVVIFNWANGNLGIPAVEEKVPEVITTTLLAPPPPPKPKPKPVPRPPKPKVKPRRPAPPPPPPSPVAETPPLAPSPALPLAEVDVADIAGEPVEELIAEPDTSAADEAETVSVPVEAEPTAPAFKFSAPPSAELTYDVRALSKGQNWYGSGVFKWDTDGSRYRIFGEAYVTIFIKLTALNFTSEGLIANFGLAPVLYTEKPRNKSATNTHFQHANGKISFSASTANYPYKGGEQDRASIIWQLAGIGRADAEQFTPGTTFEIVVAGKRDAESWRIQVVGLEEVDTGEGTTTAWHVLRAPRPGSYDEKLDIWLAPGKDWHPVKVLYTYANGDYTELSLSEMKPLAEEE